MTQSKKLERRIVDLESAADTAIRALASAPTQTVSTMEALEALGVVMAHRNRVVLSEARTASRISH